MGCRSYYSKFEVILKKVIVKKGEFKKLIIGLKNHSKSIVNFKDQTKFMPLNVNHYLDENEHLHFNI